MIKSLQLLLFVLFLQGFAGIVHCANSQYSRMPNEPVVVFLDIRFDGEIIVYCEPDGDTCTSLHNDLQEQDFVMFTINGMNDSMYYVTAFSSLTDSIYVTGWIKKNSHLGVFSSAYSKGKPLRLYESPSKGSNAIITEPTYNPNVYEVIDANGKWLKVKTHIGNDSFEGWMPPSSQCANPYTTCS